MTDAVIVQLNRSSVFKLVIYLNVNGVCCGIEVKMKGKTQTICVWLARQIINKMAYVNNYAFRLNKVAFNRDAEKTNYF